MLENKLREDLERLKKIRAHRGLRHYWGYVTFPVLYYCCINKSFLLRFPHSTCNNLFFFLASVFAVSTQKPPVVVGVLLVCRRKSKLRPAILEKCISVEYCLRKWSINSWIPKRVFKPFYNKII